MLMVDNGLALAERSISDFDKLYEDMPINKVEIVEVDEISEVIGTINLRSVCSHSFYKYEIPCPAYEALRYCAAHEPEKLVKMLANATETDA